ncbi:hypothetical protein [Paractinoplanes brasiliensis]|uniref:Uncharacterized protein n=1 Tax=Paractinoplanes brasiliensis TaxID=52695 RepID=A0A4R6JPM8_9ACTN|nr:hypothetical protein [Actinoplanes brasiliensis]TDO38390.1 hypothetical protein C8E87_2043 [Actinoplanes brasiliensis]GID26834.1 hypothetical protein Abr02nite_18170 [Actinoplanes brasiliensis]
MSDKWLRVQADEVRERNRRRREEQMAEAQRLADERRRKAGR